MVFSLSSFSMQLHHYVCEELKNMALFVDNTPTAWLLLKMKQTENRSHAALSLRSEEKSSTREFGKDCKRFNDLK